MALLAAARGPFAAWGYGAVRRRRDRAAGVPGLRRLFARRTAGTAGNPESGSDFRVISRV